MENEALVLDFLEWLGDRSHSYDCVMGVWRTSCPRLTIWEDSLDAGFVRIERGCVSRSAAGRRFLESNRRPEWGKAWTS